MNFLSVAEMISAAESENTALSQVTLEQSAKDMEKSVEEVYEMMTAHFQMMKESVKKGLSDESRSASGLSGGMAQKVKRLGEAGKHITGDFINEVIYSALAVSEMNARMGKIVAAPTAGSCGILPACLVSLQNHFGISDEKAVMGLINASGIGMVIARNASISGAEGGCQAECGSAAAMAASAVVEIMGGTPKECGSAAAQALKSFMGLVCDPVAGLVEEPCAIRNVSCAVVAVTSAELALAGVESVIPVDEVIEAMNSVGKILPHALKETSEGGIAVTGTAKEIADRLAIESESSKRDGTVANVN